MKKTLKVLVLLLSVALIVGAIAVVASADTPVENTVEYTVNGEVVTTSDGSFDSAIAAIKEAKTEEANYKIKLLGNNTASAVDFSDTALADGIKRNITVDLNGYTLDMSATATAFTAGQYVDLTVEGEGITVVIGGIEGAKSPIDPGWAYFNITSAETGSVTVNITYLPVSHIINIFYDISHSLTVIGVNRIITLREEIK